MQLHSVLALKASISQDILQVKDKVILDDYEGKEELLIMVWIIFVKVLKQIAESSPDGALTQDIVVPIKSKIVHTTCNRVENLKNPHFLPEV